MCSVHDAFSCSADCCCSAADGRLRRTRQLLFCGRVDLLFFGVVDSHIFPLEGASTATAIPVATAFIKEPIPYDVVSPFAFQCVADCTDSLLRGLLVPRPLPLHPGDSSVTIRHDYY